MDRYPNISEHGLIGDLQTAALVTTGGSVDWFCCPRFDSPSIFGALLDADKGGSKSSQGSTTGGPSTPWRSPATASCSAQATST